MFSVIVLVNGEEELKGKLRQDKFEKRPQRLFLHIPKKKTVFIMPSFRSFNVPLFPALLMLPSKIPLELRAAASLSMLALWMFLCSLVSALMLVWTFHCHRMYV